MSARASSSADREVLITRIINAPRDLVFGAWVDSKHADKWMGPTGYTTVTQSMDVRPGGMWRFTMSGPQGVFPNRVTYIEVEKPSRLVYKHGADKDNDPDAFEVTVTLRGRSATTRRTSPCVPCSRRRAVARQGGEGVQGDRGRLSDAGAALRAAPAPLEAGTAQLRRAVPASAALRVEEPEHRPASQNSPPRQREAVTVRPPRRQTRG